jgi:hypothetical protein
MSNNPLLRHPWLTPLSCRGTKRIEPRDRAGNNSYVWAVVEWLPAIIHPVLTCKARATAGKKQTSCTNSGLITLCKRLVGSLDGSTTMPWSVDPASRPTTFHCVTVSTQLGGRKLKVHGRGVAISLLSYYSHKKNLLLVRIQTEQQYICSEYLLGTTRHSRDACHLVSALYSRCLTLKTHLHAASVSKVTRE